MVLMVSGGGVEVDGGKTSMMVLCGGGVEVVVGGTTIMVPSCRVVVGVGRVDDREGGSPVGQHLNKIIPILSIPPPNTLAVMKLQPYGRDQAE